MKRIKNILGRNFKKVRSSDLLSKRQRSLRMAGIRSKATKLELGFIRALKAATAIKFETNVTDIAGRPDIVFRQQKICIFLDSNFWHGWQYPRWRHLLKNSFWKTKIETNRKRDQKITRKLRRHGWTVFRFWEYDLKKDRENVVKMLLRYLNGVDR